MFRSNYRQSGSYLFVNIPRTLGLDDVLEPLDFLTPATKKFGGILGPGESPLQVLHLDALRRYAKSSLAHLAHLAQTVQHV